MGSDHGSYSRDMFSENKRYIQRRVQQGVPWVDADDNDLQQGTYNIVRRVEQLLGDGCVGDGFKCVGTGAVNDFTILGGDGTADGAGRFYLKGNGCLLFGPTTWKNIGVSEDDKSVHPRITAIEYVAATNKTLIMDSAANWDTNEHAGKTTTPDVTQPGSTFVVDSNTRTQLTVDGDATAVAQVGDGYRIEMTTPSGTNRVDGVFLDVYLDEFDCEDDPNLKHNLSTQVCAQLRIKLIQTLYVKEGSEVYPDFVDSDGKQHYTFQVARLLRYDGQSAINAPDVIDLRRPIMGNDLWRLWELYNNLRVVPNDTEDNTVNVLPGWWTISDRSDIKRLPVQTVSGTFSAVTAVGRTRFDLVSIDDSGALTIRQGSEVVGAGDPWVDAPPPWANQLALGIVRINETTTPVITEGDITDSREFLNIGGAPINLDAYDSATWLLCRPQAIPDATVRINPGVYIKSDNTLPIYKGSMFSSPSFSSVGTPGNDRYDLLCMDDAGSPVITTGTEGSGGTAWSRCPTIPTGQLLIAIVRVTEVGAVTVDASDVSDAREYLNKGGSGGGGTTEFNGLVSIDQFRPDDEFPAENVELWQMESAMRFQAWEDQYAWFSIERASSLDTTKDINFRLAYALTNDGAAGETAKIDLDYWVVQDGQRPDINTPDNTKTDTLSVAANLGDRLYYTTLTNIKIDTADLPAGANRGRIVCRIKRDTGVGSNTPAAFDVVSLFPYQV